MIAPDRQPLTGLVEVDETMISYATHRPAAAGAATRASIKMILTKQTLELIVIVYNHY